MNLLNSNRRHRHDPAAPGIEAVVTTQLRDLTARRLRSRGRARRARANAALLLVLISSGCGAKQDGHDAAASRPPTPTSTTPVESGHLLFSRFDESAQDFLGTYLTSTDGSDATEVHLPGPEGGGRFSHAGDAIAAMTMLDDGRIGTAVITPNGKVLRTLKIDHPTLNLFCDTWSPDDKRLACEGFDDAHPALRGIYTVDARTGGDMARLTTTPSGQADIPGDFSPDGTTLIFNRQPKDDERGALLTVPTAGGPAQKFGPPIANVEDPGRFSPDGQTVVTSADGVLIFLDRTGTVIGRVSQSGRYLFGAVWSPSGDHIAYSSNANHTVADIFVARRDGSQRLQVTKSPYNEIDVDWGR